MVAFPLNAALSSTDGNFSILSTRGFALSKVTEPGPRYFDQVSVTGGRCVDTRVPVPLKYLMSSVIQSVNSRGADNEAVRAGALARVAIGPWIAGPFCSNRITGGVLLADISMKGLMT